MSGSGEKSTYVGDEAQGQRGLLMINYPIERGIVTNWDDMEFIWNHIFSNELRVDPEEHTVLLTDSPFNPKQNRSKMTEVMFEQFRVPKLYVCQQSVLSMYASGRITGMIVDCGDGVSLAMPIYEGYGLPHAMKRMDLGGRDITEYLGRIMVENGYSFKTSAEIQICRDIKEKLCYVAMDHDDEMQKWKDGESMERSYELPDENIVRIGTERFRCTETLFNPSLLGLEETGIDEMVFNSIRKCEMDLVGDLYSNVVLLGGSTMIVGFSERLSKGVINWAPRSARVRVIASPERKYLAWIGGSYVSSIPSYTDERGMNREDYDEKGPGYIHQCCY